MQQQRWSLRRMNVMFFILLVFVQKDATTKRYKIKLIYPIKLVKLTNI